MIIIIEPWPSEVVCLGKRGKLRKLGPSQITFLSNLLWSSSKSSLLSSSSTALSKQPPGNVSGDLTGVTFPTKKKMKNVRSFRPCLPYIKIRRRKKVIKIWAKVRTCKMRRRAFGSPGANAFCHNRADGCTCSYNLLWQQPILDTR